MAGGIVGADAREMCKSSSPRLLCFLIGMAEAVVPLELGIFSPDGKGERPAGEAIEVGRMKSSRFIGSLWEVRMVASLEFRSRAMPLGPAFDAEEFVGILLSRLF